MDIRKSTENDFETIMKTYAFAGKFMAEHGNPNQWGSTNWPPENLIHKDIAAGNSYVCIETGKIAGTFFIISVKTSSLRTESLPTANGLVTVLTAWFTESRETELLKVSGHFA